MRIELEIIFNVNTSPIGTQFTTDDGATTAQKERNILFVKRKIQNFDGYNFRKLNTVAHLKLNNVQPKQKYKQMNKNAHRFFLHRKKKKN